MPRPSSKPAPKAKPATAASPSAREPRGARRRRETREKLLEAAFHLMAERGSDGVTINEITEAADVGIGSFYNHFETKEALHAAVLDKLFEEFGDALDHLVKDVEDPAEKVAVCVRHTILRARREPRWGRFLVREGFSPHVMDRGLGARLLRDIQIGMAKGRFETPDPMMSFVAAGAGVLGAITAEIDFAADPALQKQLGLEARDIPERAAMILLHGLGLTFDQARSVSRRPLPVVDRPSAP
ncbi:MAG TPA: TetR/AcrR family transcriptional regulator [Nevskiaceae bacterium]|nr:TetR/AcrR family transcriptional regulator [Nevskiaceae bacterium]